MVNEEQARQWGADMGRHWVKEQAAMDALLQQPLDLLLAHAGIRKGDRVLDIGCGTGASTLRAADEVGPSGEVLGIDISQVMIDRAKERADEALAEHVAFMVADAQTHSFPEGRFDRAISRFGVMFFADPVAAFRNIARGIRPGGTLSFVAWSGPHDNPWFTIPMRIASAHFGVVPERGDPRAPGPMAFGDLDHVRSILTEAGLAEVEAITHDVFLTPLGSLQDAVALSTRLGPAGRLLLERNGTDDDRISIEDGVAEALAAFDQDGQILIPAVVTRFSAIRGKSA